MASTVAFDGMHDPLKEKLDCLSPLADFHVVRSSSGRSHRREDSQGSTDVSSAEDAVNMSSAPPSCIGETQFLSEVEVEQGQDRGSQSGSRRGSKASAHTPDDVGGLLLQAFQMKDEYLQLQHRFGALQDTAREEVSGLRAELNSAYDQIWALKSQVAALQATTADLRTKVVAAPKGAAGQLAEGVLKLAARSCGARAACFEAWHDHVTFARAQLRLRVLSTTAAADQQRGLVCQCFSAWARHGRQKDMEAYTHAFFLGLGVDDGMCASKRVEGKKETMGANSLAWERQATLTDGAGPVFEVDMIAPPDEVFILTTHGNATSTRTPPRDRYHGLRTPEAQSTPSCSPLCSPGPTPGRALLPSAAPRLPSGPAVLNCSTEARLIK